MNTTHIKLNAGLQARPRSARQSRPFASCVWGGGGGQNTRCPAQSVRAGNRSGSDTSRDSVPTCTVFCFVTVSCWEILGECLFFLTDKLLCHCCPSSDKHTQIMSHRGSLLRQPVCLFVLFMRVIFETYLFYVFWF